MVENNNGDLTHFKWWTIECIASLIVIFSYYDEFSTSRDELSSRDFWIFYSSIVSTLISMFGLVVCLLPIERKACSLESLLVWFIAILRSTTTIVGIIGRNRVDAENTLLSNYRLLALHPNVYFFSLWALIASILMVASWYKRLLNLTTEWQTSTQWILLGAMSFFTMLSALVFRDQTVTGEFTNSTQYNISRSDLVSTVNSLTIDGTISNSTTIGNLTNVYLASDETRATNPAQALFGALVDVGVMETVSSCETASFSCFRIHYVIGLSAATFVLACFLAPLKGTNRTFQVDVSIILFLLWLPSLPILTVSPGPATRAGNLFFGIYISYFLVLKIFIYSVTFRASSENTNGIADDLKESEPINRKILWKAAYGKLERNSTFDQDERDENDSWESLFDEPELWDEETEARISSRKNSMSLEDSLVGSRRASRRMTTFYAMKLLPDESAISSLLDRKDYIKPIGWDRRTRRLKLWFVLLSMAIVLTHTVSKFEAGPATRITAWMSIFVSCIGLVTCFRTSKVSYILQVTSIIIELAIWSYGAVLFVGSQNTHVLGYSSAEDQVNLLLGDRVQTLAEDPNIFFGVWISVITVILLVTNICKASLITTDWLLFATASVALLVSSLESILKQEGDGSETVRRMCDTDDSITCKRFLFAMYLAIASVCVSLPMALLFRCRFGPTLHVIVSIPLVIAWGFGVSYVTFTNARSAPAAVYFAFWGGIFLALEIASINIIIMRRIKRKKREEALAENENEDVSFSSALMKEISLPSLKESKLEVSELDLKIPAPPNISYNAQTMQEGSNDFDSDRSIKSNSGNSQEKDDNTKEKNLRQSSQSFKEIIFLDENQQEYEKSIVKNLKVQSKILNVESNVIGNEHHSSERSKASSYCLGAYEDSGNRDQNHSSLIGPNTIESRSSSADTGDFEECFQLEQQNVF